MSEYLKLTAYIPNAEGYVKNDNPVVYVNKNTISIVSKDIVDNNTRIELTNGNVLCVMESPEEIIQSEVINETKLE